MTDTPTPARSPEQTVKEAVAAAKQFEKVLDRLDAEQAELTDSVLRDLEMKKIKPRKGFRGLLEQWFKRNV